MRLVNTDTISHKLLFNNQFFLLLLFLFLFSNIAGCSNLFFVPDRQLILEPDRLKLEFEDIYVLTEDQEKLHGWLLKGKQPIKGTLIFLHGNAQNISYHIASVRWLPKHHYNVFLYDYRGYGKSTGKPTLENSISDFSAVIKKLDDVLPESEKQYSIFGQSLGGALAIAAVADTQASHEYSALIVDSAFSGFRKIAKEKMSDMLLTKPFSGVLKHLFSAEPDLLNQITSIHSTPILILHGLEDKIVPPTHGKLLYDYANHPKQLHLQAGAKHIQSLASGPVRQKMLNVLNGETVFE